MTAAAVVHEWQKKNERDINEDVSPGVKVAEPSSGGIRRPFTTTGSMRLITATAHDTK
ncbi:MAG: hypothetical protein HC805_03220 [Alkalinema sp. RL_2_19]|nr:hypothetical protein [Alkalinema sp. RL_2_19]